MLLVVVPAVLLAVSNARFGHASPLHGMDAPWRWTLDAARSWWHRLTDQLDTSDELIDVFVRLALLVAWVCVGVVVVTIVGEVVFQLRHGMPSSGHHDVLGLVWLGRAVAGGLVAMLPLAAATPALASGPVVRRVPATAPVVAGDRRPAPTGMSAPMPDRRPGSSSTAVDGPPPAPAPVSTTYVVQRGDSVWSIATRVAGPGGDIAAIAAQIVDDNRGATMSDGRRFTTPALIEPGWHLAVPVLHGLLPIAAPIDEPPIDEPPTVEPPPTMATADPAPGEHLVVAGDSYWRIAEAQLEAVHGEQPAAVDVLGYTERLIAANAPRLDHDDRHLILPGESVVLVPDAAAAPEREVAWVPPVTDASSSAGADPASAADESATGSAASDQSPASTATEPMGTPPGPAAEVPVLGGAAAAPDLPAPDLPNVSADPMVAVMSGAAASVDASAPPSERGPGPGPSPVAPTSARDVVAGGTTEGGSDVPVGLALGTSVLFATGALGLIETKRRQRLRSATMDQRLAAPRSRETATEIELRATAAPERLARLDVALRVAAPDLAVQDARIVAVEVGVAGDLRLVADRPATPGGDAWRLDMDGRTWVLDGRWSLEDLAGHARRSVAPCPALAHVGSTDRGQLFVDLEAVGLLAIDLPEPMATDVLRCIAASIALSPLAGGVQVVTVGLRGEMFASPTASIDEAATLDAALELAAASLGTTREAARGSSTFALRSRGVGLESWEPAVVIATGDHGGALEAARTAAGDGLAVVVAARHSGATWRMEVRDDRVVLAPLGTAITPCGLSVGALAGVGELVAATAAPLELRPARVVRLREPDDSVTGDRPPSAEAGPIEPEWSLLVRLFGQVEVVTEEGSLAAFERSKALELVVWLTQHRRRPTRTAARTALWDVGCARRHVRQRRQRRSPCHGARRSAAAGRGVAGAYAHRGPAAARRGGHRRRPHRGACRAGPFLPAARGRRGAPSCRRPRRRDAVRRHVVPVARRRRDHLGTHPLGDRRGDAAGQPVPRPGRRRGRLLGHRPRAAGAGRARGADRPADAGVRRGGRSRRGAPRVGGLRAGDRRRPVDLGGAVPEARGVAPRPARRAEHRSGGPVSGGVLGIGVDAVDIERFRTSLARTPSMRTRLFTASELADVAARSDQVPALAARFAAREAVMKAMGLGLGAFGFHEVWVAKAASGAPSLVVTGRALVLAGERGITQWLLSLTHSDLVAIAQVVAQ